MKKFFYTLILLFISFSAYSQSNEKISEILSSQQVTYGQVCYLSAVMQHLIPEDSSYEDAIQALYKVKQLPQLVYAEDPIALVNIAFLYSQIWDIKGGVMYKLTRGSPRYAFKKMKNDGVISQSSDPTMIVSGQKAMSLLTSCLYNYGNQSLTIDDEENETTGN